MTNSTTKDDPERPAASFVLGFDVDGPTGPEIISGAIWRMPGYFGLGSYGPYRALPRILDILKSHDVAATFFTPAWVVRTWPDLCRRILAEGHEIAGHGDLHETFYGRDREDQFRILQNSQETFQNVLGRRATGFRAPQGDFGPETLELLAECGYTYSSSMRSGDRPYRHHEAPLAELPAKSLFDDGSAFAYHRAPNFPRGLDRIAPYRPVFRSWGEEIDGAAEEGLPVVTIWHPKILGSPGRLTLFDNFIRDLVDRETVQIKRADEVVSDFLNDDKSTISELE